MSEPLYEQRDQKSVSTLSSVSRPLVPVLQYREDGTPVYELTGDELVFPIVDGPREFYVHMLQYRFQDFKDLMADVGIRMKPQAGGIVQMVPADPAAVIPFFWKYFIRLSGVVKKDGSEPTVEEQIAFIKANPKMRIPETTVLQGYGGIRPLEPQVEDQSRTLVIDDVGDENVVRTYLWLHDPQKGESYRVLLSHRFRPSKERDVRIYTQATGQSQMNTRKQEMIRRENLDSLEILYRETILEAPGFTIQGEPCTEANKDLWAGKIPLWHMTNALDELYRGVQVKN